MDELTNGVVELVRVTVEEHVEVSELVEDILFALPVFEEEEGDEVFVGELYQFFGGESQSVSMFLLAEVVFEHEVVHRGIQTHSFVGLADKFVLACKYFDQFGGEIEVKFVVFLFVGVFAHLQEQFVVVDLLQLAFILFGRAAN